MQADLASIEDILRATSWLVLEQPETIKQAISIAN
jgi:hypothetical protein